MCVLQKYLHNTMNYIQATRFILFFLILSAAPPRLFQTETLERELKDPEGFFFYPCCIREFSHKIPIIMVF